VKNKKGALQAAQTEMQRCKQSQMNLNAFKEYLDSLQEVLSQRHDAVRQADRDLNAALWALDDLEKKIQEQQIVADTAASLLTGSKALVLEAKEALQVAEEDRNALMEQVGQAKQQLADLREKLSNLKTASEAILEIKKYVSATALKMGYFVELAVRTPVRDIGLKESVDVWDYFSQDVSQNTCSAAFKTKLHDFHDYCTGTAISAFEKIKDYVDLTPLCQLRDESKINNEGSDAVQTRIRHLTDSLRSVQSWLDPLHGTVTTAQDEQLALENGEPEGLRQIMGVYGHVNFYTKYLKQWKFGKKKRLGKFHRLLAQLKTHIESLDTQVLEAETLHRQLSDTLGKLSYAHQVATDKVTAAVDQESWAVRGKEETQKALASMQQQRDETNNLLKDLEEAYRVAIKQYKEARENLVQEHVAGKDQVQASFLAN